MSQSTSAPDQRPLTPPPPTGSPYSYVAPAPHSTPSTPKRRPKRPLWVVIVAIIVGVAVLGSLASCAVSNLSFASSAIGVIDIDGTIGQDGGANVPEGLLAQLSEAENDPTTAAVVLRVNSGGGAAAAGEEMARYVADFSKPIVVSTASGNASAAYLISSQADYIFANEASSVGAIGTAMQLTDYSKLLDLLGIDVRTITSANSKDASYGHRPLTQEEIDYFQAQVDQINKSFIESVAQGRHMEVSAVEKLATGLSFTGSDALENGLIDEIGTYKDALNKAAQLAGLRSYHAEHLGSSDLGLIELLSALLANTSTVSNEETNIALQEGTGVNGAIS